MPGLLDIMPGGGDDLDPVLQNYMKQQRQQQFWGMLSRMGQALMSANRQGQPPMRALAAGMAQGGGGGTDPMQMLKMQDYLQKRRTQQGEQATRDAQAGQYSQIVGGPDPTTGIDWQTGRMGPGQPGEGLLGLAKQRGTDPALMRGMLAGMGPQAGSQALLGMTEPKAPVEKFTTVQSPYGRGGVAQQSSTSGKYVNYQDPKKADKATSRRYRPQGPYVDSETGEFLGEGFYDTRDDVLTLKKGGKTIPMPENAMPRTEGGLIKGAMTGDQFYSLSSDVQQEEKTLREFSRYMKNVQNTEQGWSLLADQFLGTMSTIFGGELTPTEYRTLLQSGQFQGLLGGARLEVVGGGVMTEKDAERIIARLGGDLSATRNREVAAQLIKEMMQEKAEKYNTTLLPQYNYQTRVIPRGNFRVKKPIKLDESIFARPTEAPQADQQADIPTFTDPNDPAFLALPAGSVFRDEEGTLRFK